MPIFERGSSQCRAQHGWLAYAYSRARSELAFFRRQNGRAFFPPLPIAALLPRSWRWAYLPLAGWEVPMWLGNFAAWMNGLIFLFLDGAGHTYPLRVEYFDATWVFCNAKSQRDFKSTLAFLASHEARRRMAVYAMQLAGNHTRPASREACRRAAVISQSSCMSHERPARPRRAEIGAGH